MSYKLEALKREVVARSKSDHAEIAFGEWAIVDYFEVSKPGSCLCTHFPVVNFVRLFNPNTKSQIEVGNCCVKKFFGVDAQQIFKAVEKLRKNPRGPMPIEAVRLFDRYNQFSEWDKGFLFERGYGDATPMYKRRGFATGKQLDTRERIARRCLEWFDAYTPVHGIMPIASGGDRHD